MNFKQIIERLRAAGVPDAAIPAVMEMLDEREAEARRPRTGTERSRVCRERQRNENATKTLPDRSDDVAAALPGRCADVAPALPDPAPRARVLYREEVSYTLEASASKGADAPSTAEPIIDPDDKPLTPDSMLYKRAREVAGPKAGQFVTLLKRQNGGDVADTRQMVEQAALADDPLKYLIGITQRGRRKAEFTHERPPPYRREPQLSAALQVALEFENADAAHEDEDNIPTRQASGADGPDGRGGAVVWLASAR